MKEDIDFQEIVIFTIILCGMVLAGIQLCLQTYYNAQVELAVHECSCPVLQVN